jgi:tRNA (guanine-N(7)-)-methyltransferase subunit TRM82
MEPPYHLITTVGNQLFAAQGGDLHSFDLSNGSYLSGWQHPGSLNAQNGKHDILPENDAHPEDEQGVGKAEDGPRHEQPAAKRRKLSTGTDETTETTGDATETRNGEEGAEEPADGAEGLAKKPVGRLSKMATQDRAVITSLTATPDQQHLVTATGLDKTLRVFSHDEHGSLNLLSER